MKKILVLGAGKSATTLISYLLKNAAQYNWHITVGDFNIDIAAQKIDGHKHGTAIFFDVKNADLRAKCVQEHDIVASVLPAVFHQMVALDCLKYEKHIVTPSYLSKEAEALDAAFKAKNLLFMGEIGLDPGIDHMSMMRTLDEIKAKGANIQAVRSFCGALIAPESDNNPWNYKFTWAPMNVILAGQGTAQYLKNGQPKYIPYNRLFSLTENYHIDKLGTYEAYANRDSLSYLDKYELSEIPTFIRGTLRKKGYCEAWNAFVKLGLTDNNISIYNTEKLTYADLIGAFLPANYTADHADIQTALAEFLNIGVASPVMKKLAWLGLFDNNNFIGQGPATPAKILHDLLVKKWALEEADVDMIIMLHKIDYELNGTIFSHTSTMVQKGKDAEQTALAATVGLPMGMMIKLLLTTDLQLSGVQIPIMKAVYEPILKELEEYDVFFIDKEEEI
ncbi:MAG: saccharopine dehydrogenase C-terminal domain-containing protein [Chitinophagales bacterium]